MGHICMIVVDTQAQLVEKYKNCGQEHVFAFFDQCSSEEKAQLTTQLAEIDVDRVKKIWKNLQSSDPASKIDSKLLEPLSNVCKTFDDSGRKTKDCLEWEKIGIDLVSKGQVAALTLAGGQGTRLGSSSPKGCYNIGLPSGKSLFQIQAERIISLQKLSECKSDVFVHWFVMTSGPTHNETVSFFEKHNFFQLDKRQIHFFQQGVLPCLTFDGKIMMETRSKVAVSPDGNGGIYAALTKTGTLQKMKELNIKYVHMYSVDNCLVKPADPAFVGYCHKQNCDSGIKVVGKSSPQEPVGVVCKYKNKYSIVEYSEIEKQVAEKVDNQGNIIFKDANIANHIFTVDFLTKIDETALTYHVAKKKIPCVDMKDGSAIKPSSPNGIKLELFVFDVLPTLNNLAVLQVLRQDEFSPLKNAPGAGEDCPETSRRDVMNLCKKQLEIAGAQVKPAADGTFVCEISPCLSYSGENLEKAKGKIIQCPAIISSTDFFDK